MCFKHSRPQRIISGLRETFIKRYIVETTVPIRQKSDRKNRVRKQRVVGINYGMKYSWKGLKDTNKHKNRIKKKKKEWASSAGIIMSKT